MKKTNDKKEKKVSAREKYGVPKPIGAKKQK